MSERDVPHTMRAVRLAAYTDPPGLEVRSVAVPWPGPGQVLVRVSAAPILADDVVFCRGRHGFRRALPTTPGFEGCGEVIAVGSGLVTRFLVGRRVAFVVGDEQDGAWAEYAVLDASRCLPLWDGIDDEQAASLLVEPITAIGLLADVKTRRHAGVVLTAPTRPIGRMLLQLARRERLPVVLIVTSPDEAAEVRAFGGAEPVVDVQEPGSDGRLRRATRAWSASAVLDGVGGALTGRLLAAMPDGAEAVLYGLPSEAPVAFDVADLVHRRKVVRGFSFVDQVKAQGPRGLLAHSRRLRQQAEVFRQPVARRLTLDEVPGVVREGVPVERLLVRPQGPPAG